MVDHVTAVLGQRGAPGTAPRGTGGGGTTSGPESPEPPSNQARVRQAKHAEHAGRTEPGTPAPSGCHEPTSDRFSLTLSSFGVPTVEQCSQSMGVLSRQLSPPMVLELEQYFRAHKYHTWRGLRDSSGAEFVVRALTAVQALHGMRANGQLDDPLVRHLTIALSADGRHHAAIRLVDEYFRLPVDWHSRPIRVDHEGTHTGGAPPTPTPGQRVQPIWLPLASLPTASGNGYEAFVQTVRTVTGGASSVAGPSPGGPSPGMAPSVPLPTPEGWSDRAGEAMGGWWSRHVDGPPLGDVECDRAVAEFRRRFTPAMQLELEQYYRVTTGDVWSLHGLTGVRFVVQSIAHQAGGGAADEGKLDADGVRQLVVRLATGKRHHAAVRLAAEWYGIPVDWEAMPVRLDLSGSEPECGPDAVHLSSGDFPKDEDDGSYELFLRALVRVTRRAGYCPDGPPGPEVDKEMAIGRFLAQYDAIYATGLPEPGRADRVELLKTALGLLKPLFSDGKLQEERLRPQVERLLVDQVFAALDHFQDKPGRGSRTDWDETYRAQVFVMMDALPERLRTPGMKEAYKRTFGKDF